MKIARHWKRAEIEARSPEGKPMTVTAWGWSATGAEEAQQRAQEAVRRSAARIAAGQGFPDRYDYLDRPPREEIIEEITDLAMVTRNSYGSLILNTKDLMFIDIDVPFESSFPRLIRSFKHLFGITAESPTDRIRDRIAVIARSRPAYTCRIYQTAAGFRCIVINKRIHPNSPESNELLLAFDADPLYVRLCKNQESFRGRLTPKHWRCGVDRPTGRFPFETDDDDKRFRTWQKTYETVCERYATCTFVEQFGTQEGVADFRKLIEIHDRLTRSNSGLDLA
ncbi:MAG TPA: hypothetical protein VK612_03850 [Pyrinomonadaceae bacterium]|nr:hypothetical protein [Pyrinomonadaceae bacterium]